MMDRDQQDNLPKMQVGFIDSICLPLYRVNASLCMWPLIAWLKLTIVSGFQALSESFPWVKPIYDSCLENRAHWSKLADLVDIGLTWIDHPYIDRPVEQLMSSKAFIRLDSTLQRRFLRVLFL